MFPVLGRLVPSSPPKAHALASEHPIGLQLVQEEYFIMSNHSYRLMQYHQRLDDELRSEVRRSWPNFDRIQRLKKLKLIVKDRLQRLMRGGKGPQTA
jgi:hypothetical protein